MVAVLVLAASVIKTQFHQIGSGEHQHCTQPRSLLSASESKGESTQGAAARRVTDPDPHRIPAAVACKSETHLVFVVF